MTSSSQASTLRVRLVGWGRLSIYLALLGPFACRTTSDTEAQPAPSGRRGASSVKRGARVVVEKTAGEFLEAIVVSEQPEHLGLQSVDGADTLRVTRTDVYPLTERKLETQSNAPAICGLHRLAWRACKVERAEAAFTRVVTPDAQRFELAADQVLAVTELTRLNIEQAFVRAERRREFSQELAKLKGPRAPAGWRVSPGERVVARRQGDWFAARVAEIEDDGVRVRFTGQNIVEKLDTEAVIPEPPYPVELERGDFALHRPRAAAEAWNYVRVRVKSDELKVEDVNGNVLHVESTSLIPIRP